MKAPPVLVPCSHTATAYIEAIKSSLTERNSKMTTRKKRISENQPRIFLWDIDFSKHKVVNNQRVIKVQHVRFNSTKYYYDVRLLEGRLLQKK